MSDFRWTHTSIWAAQCLRTIGNWARPDKGLLHRLLSINSSHHELSRLVQAKIAEGRWRRLWWGGRVYEYRLTEYGWKATVPKGGPDVR